MKLLELSRALTGVSVAALFSVSMTIAAAEMEDTIEVSSSAFSHHGTVPEVNSAYGDNVSIDLGWANLPAGTVSLALVADDPVVPMPQPFVHWVAYNIPASADGLPAGMKSDESVTEPGLEGMINGVNGLRRTGYFGPRPPADGKLHAYHFRLYALDSDLELSAGLNKEQLLEAIEGHVLGTGMLMGHYERKE